MEDHTVPWRASFAAAAVPLSVIDTTGRLVAWNEACSEMLGYPHDTLDSLDVGRITRPEDQAWTRRYLLRLMSGEIDRFETDKIYVRADGSEIRTRLTCRVLTDDSGHCTHIVATNVPIPDESTIVAYGVAERLLEYGNETVSLIDPDGTIRFVKGGRSEVQGYPASFWRDRSVADVLAPGEWERVVELRDTVAATPGTTIEFQVEIVTGRGEPRTIATQVTNCIDDPVLAGLVVVTRDITDERAALAELTRRRRTAEAVVDARTRLLATVSHELRNPLHAVQGIAELFADEELPPRAAELARSLLRQISGLARVTEDLLDAARLDAGAVAIEPVPTDLVAMVGDVVDLARAATGDKPVTVTSRVAYGVPSWVEADPDRIRQVLTNLMGNAVKFTERGSVQLVVRPDGPGSIAFSVIDSGVGIPVVEQTTVLEPFVVASTAGAGRGAGLGLSIVQRLVAAMGGRLTLTSTVGDGTRFDVSLPLPTSDPPAPERAPGELSGLRVLVVEDNPVNQQLARRQLERLDIDATIVGTGEEGFALLTSEQPESFDVILMDHRLPGWSGIETTERIRSLDGAPGATPIVGVSASTATADRDRFIAAGMDELVTKPATLDDLAGAIRRVLPDRARSTRGDPAPPHEHDGRSALEPDGEVLDRAVLDQLADELGDGGVVEQLVTTFLDELDDRVVAIDGSEGGSHDGSDDGSDDVAARRAAHTLQSSARLLGVSALADACLDIEHGATPRPPVADLATRARAQLEEWLYDRHR